MVHESIFNVADGRYRCPSTQQGYSPFSTWTRGLAWILCGFAEQLEFLASIDAEKAGISPEKFDETVLAFLRAATATADWWISHSFADGMVYWDAGRRGFRSMIIRRSAIRLTILSRSIPAPPPSRLRDCYGWEGILDKAGLNMCRPD